MSCSNVVGTCCDESERGCELERTKEWKNVANDEEGGGVVQHCHDVECRLKR